VCPNHEKSQPKPTQPMSISGLTETLRGKGGRFGPSVRLNVTLIGSHKLLNMTLNVLEGHTTNYLKSFYIQHLQYYSPCSLYEMLASE